MSSYLGRRKKSVMLILGTFSSVHHRNQMESSTGTTIALELGYIGKREKVSRA